MQAFAFRLVTCTVPTTTREIEHRVPRCSCAESGATSHVSFDFSYRQQTTHKKISILSIPSIPSIIMITSYFKRKNEKSDPSTKENKPASGRKHRRLSSDEDSGEGGGDGDDGTKKSDGTNNNNNKRQKQDNDTTDTITDPSTINDRISKLPCPEATELLSHLKEQSWRNKLINHVSKPSFFKLAKFVATER